MVGIARVNHSASYITEKDKHTETWVQRRKCYKTLRKIIGGLQGGQQTVGNISLPNVMTMYLTVKTNELTKSVEALLIPHS